VTLNSRTENNHRYTVTGLIKGTATLDELRILFNAWNPDETPQDFANRVQLDGILTKQTAKRLNDLVLLVFQPWFLAPDNRAARRLKAFNQLGGDRQVFNELVFVYKARSEAVLYDFVKDAFWMASNEGALYLRTRDIEDFLRQAQESDRVEKPWSKSTQRRLAHGVLGALTNIGFLREEKRYQYDYVSYHPTDFTVAYLAYDFHLAALTDGTLVEHPDWGLFGLGRRQVLERLARLDDRAGLIVQEAGSVIRITWMHKDMEGLIRAYFA
jgi:hypothetical protein